MLIKWLVMISYLQFNSRQFVTIIVEVERIFVRQQGRGAGQERHCEDHQAPKDICASHFSLVFPVFWKRRDEIMLVPNNKSNFSLKRERKGKGVTVWPQEQTITSLQLHKFTKESIGPDERCMEALIHKSKISLLLVSKNVYSCQKHTGGANLVLVLLGQLIESSMPGHSYNPQEFVRLTNIILLSLLRFSFPPLTNYFPILFFSSVEETFSLSFILVTSSHHPDLSDDNHMVIWWSLSNGPHLNQGIFTRTTIYKCISSGLPEPITTTYIFGNLKVWATNLLIRVLSYFKW